MKVSKLHLYANRALCAAALILAFTFASVPAAAQDGIGGHVGVVLPWVTHAAGQTTTLSDNFNIGFPMGITVKGPGKVAFDMEFVPAIQDTPRQVSLTFHPGLVYDLGHGIGVGMRAAFGVNSTQFGFTPLVNKSWPIGDKTGFFKAYFVEADLPVRFDQPTGLPSTTPVSFASHFGVAF